jgi:hypothetical protein
MIEWNNHGWGLNCKHNASIQTNESIFFIYWMQLEENKQLNTLNNTYHIWIQNQCKTQQKIDKNK